MVMYGKMRSKVIMEIHRNLQKDGNIWLDEIKSYNGNT